MCQLCSAPVCLSRSRVFACHLLWGQLFIPLVASKLCLDRAALESWWLCVFPSSRAPTCSLPLYPGFWCPEYFVYQSKANCMHTTLLMIELEAYFSYAKFTLLNRPIYYWPTVSSVTPALYILVQRVLRSTANRTTPASPLPWGMCFSEMAKLPPALQDNISTKILPIPFFRFVAILQLFSINEHCFHYSVAHGYPFKWTRFGNCALSSNLVLLLSRICSLIVGTMPSS
jgi:hypothetical protein